MHSSLIDLKGEWIRSEKVDVVDSIGAGDSHTGGLVAGLALGFSLRDSCRLGNEVASIVVQYQGGRFPIPKGRQGDAEMN